VREDEKGRRSAEVGDLLDTVKAYATQETVGPLQAGAKAMALGVAGVFFVGFGIIILQVALLRLLQTETSAFDGDLMSVVPYLIVFVVDLICIAVTLWFMRKGETKPGDQQSSALSPTSMPSASPNGTRASG
jgi:hypothetical protein